MYIMFYNTLFHVVPLFMHEETNQTKYASCKTCILYEYKAENKLIHEGEFEFKTFQNSHFNKPSL